MIIDAAEKNSLLRDRARVARRMSDRYVGETAEGKIIAIGVGAEDIIVYGTTLEALERVPWEFEGHNVTKILTAASKQN